MCAKVLDNKRLGKQRVEAMQIYRILVGLDEGKSWRNHPAVLMWKGYEDALAHYYNCIRKEWIKRGFKNTMPELTVRLDDGYLKNPPWLGNEKLHASHRSNLKRKSLYHYGVEDWIESIDLPYVWPTKEGLM